MIHQNQIIFLKEKFLGDICEPLISSIKDNFTLIENEELNVDKIRKIINPEEPDLIIEVCLQNFFGKNGKDSFVYSFEKMTKFLLLNQLQPNFSFCVEEIIQLLYEGLGIMLPAKIFHSKEEEEKRAIIGDILSKNSLIHDDVNYVDNSGRGYNKKDCSIERIDRNTLPEDPKERIEFISSIQNRMSKPEINYWFRDLFQDEITFSKFTKKYFLPIKLSISLEMYSIFKRLYPHYVKQGLVTAHESSCMDDLFELKLFKIKKTWI